MSDIKIYGKLNRVTADDDGRSPIVDISQVDGGQEKLPENHGGSSQRIPVFSGNKASDGGKGLLIGSIKITSSYPANVNDLTLAGVTPNSTSETTLDRYYSDMEKATEMILADCGEHRNKVVPVASGTTLNFHWDSPYFLKRHSAETHANAADKATASGPKVGVVTSRNYWNKWKAGEINSLAPHDGTVQVGGVSTTRIEHYRKYIVARYIAALRWREKVNAGTDADYSGMVSEVSDENEEKISNAIATEIESILPGYGNCPDTMGIKFKITNATDNDEPFNQTLSTRDDKGHLLTEAATNDFEAVNKKQMDTTITSTVQNIINKKNPFKSYSIAKPTDLTTDPWYRIAYTTYPSATASNIFRLNVTSIAGYHVGSLIFSVQTIENMAVEGSSAGLTILNYEYRNGTGSGIIKKIRIVSKKSTCTYIDVQISKASLSNTNTTTIKFDIESLFCNTETNNQQFVFEKTPYVVTDADLDGTEKILEKDPVKAALSKDYNIEVLKAVPATADSNTIYFIVEE